MKWTKLGNLFQVNDIHPWMKTHAANTVAEHLYDDVFRIYFSCRNENNNSSIGFVDINIQPPYEIVNIAEEPVLTPGKIGTFDDSGVSLSCIITINGVKHMYYLGWNLGVTVPWRNSIGLAIYNSSLHKYEKLSEAPILDRNHVDPYSISYPFILEDNDIFRMWYGSNLSWGKNQLDMAHLIKYAESKDGINWDRKGIVALNFKNDKEYAMSRPFVIKEEGLYKMWYSYRGQSYRIGYAESYDAISWIRKDDEVGITVSDSGWDSSTVEYPYIFKHKGKTYMLYNGNEYGKTGFGLAFMDI
jgi:predicted GH43/DUF377 family glycosyl hydrolase